MTPEDPETVTLPKAGTIRSIRVNGLPEQAVNCEVTKGDKITITVEPHKVSEPAASTAQPTYGWRLLGPREIVQKGDMVCLVAHIGDPVWVVVCSTIGRVVQANPEFAYQRKLALLSACNDNNIELTMVSVVKMIDPYASHRCELQKREIEARSGYPVGRLHHVPGVGVSAKPRTLTIYGPDMSGDDVPDATPTFKPWTSK